MYRFGLIGYGAMGNYHAQQIDTMPDFAVSAVYDIAPEKREKARAEGRDVCDSLEELLMRKDVDAVILAVPNTFHKPLAVAAMHAGKHVGSSCGERADRNAVHRTSESPLGQGFLHRP